MPPTLDDAVLGQYEGYREHHSISVPSDQMQVASQTMSSNICNCKIKCRFRALRGVPFMLTAGKSLDERAATYGGVHKSNAELMFNIQGGS